MAGKYAIMVQVKNQSEDSMEGFKYNVQPGRYRHFKGNEYQVLGMAHHSETEEELVVYLSLIHI